MKETLAQKSHEEEGEEESLNSTTDFSPPPLPSPPPLTTPTPPPQLMEEQQQPKSDNFTVEDTSTIKQDTSGSTHSQIARRNESVIVSQSMALPSTNVESVAVPEPNQSLQQYGGGGERQKENTSPDIGQSRDESQAGAKSAATLVARNMPKFNIKPAFPSTVQKKIGRPPMNSSRGEGSKMYKGTKYSPKLDSVPISKKKPSPTKSTGKLLLDAHLPKPEFILFPPKCFDVYNVF